MHGKASMGTSMPASTQRPASQAVAVPATTLQSTLDEHGFDRCTLICDIEGMELEVVRCEAQTLADRVHVLIMEVHEENGGAYCVITHDIMSARRVADYIAILWKGRIVESGPASELFNSDNQFVRQFLAGESQGPLGME